MGFWILGFRPSAKPIGGFLWILIYCWFKNSPDITLSFSVNYILFSLPFLNIIALLLWFNLDSLSNAPIQVPLRRKQYSSLFSSPLLCVNSYSAPNALGSWLNGEEAASLLTQSAWKYLRAGCNPPTTCSATVLVQLKRVLQDKWLEDSCCYSDAERPPSNWRG